MPAVWQWGLSRPRFVRVRVFPEWIGCLVARPDDSWHSTSLTRLAYVVYWAKVSPGPRLGLRQNRTMLTLSSKADVDVKSVGSTHDPVLAALSGYGVVCRSRAPIRSLRNGQL